MPAAREGTAAFGNQNGTEIKVNEGKVRVVRNYAKSVRLFLSDCLRNREPWETAWPRCLHSIRAWQPDWYKESDGCSPFEVLERAMETEYKERLMILLAGGAEEDLARLMEEV